MEFLNGLDGDVKGFESAPDGNPTWLSVVFSTEEPAESGQFAVELLDGFYLAISPQALERLDPVEWNNFPGWTLGIRASDAA